MPENDRAGLLSAMDTQALWPPDSPWVRTAVKSLPRDLFAPEIVWSWQGDRYEAVHRSHDPDAWAAAVHPGPYGTTVTQVTDGLPTSSISCVAIVATMLDTLAVEEGHRVLELGTGVGWNAALLGERTSQVVTVEIDPELGAHARRRLEAAGCRAEVVIGDGGDPLPGDGLYDRVIATYAVQQVPWSWVRRTRPGGRIVAPWGHLGCVALTVARDGASATGWMQAPAQFMPDRQERAPRPFERVRGDDPGASTQFKRSLRDLQHADALFALRVLVPDVRLSFSAGDSEPSAVWMTDGRESWATIDETGPRPAARHGGTRDLIAEITQAWQEWERREAPGMYDFGLHVTAGHQQVFTGDDPHSRPWHPLGVAAAGS
ncbi:methyltransferase domain-containing protein [Streptomyces griseus]|uniref:methyltransferase domain-containing protein n=2 Tax=Streptomyces TaxID=1883 RepID=UPI0001C1A650|nr:Methyltransferase type 11 [Streptomyces sp. ACT-1]